MSSCTFSRSFCKIFTSSSESLGKSRCVGSGHVLICCSGHKPCIQTAGERERGSFIQTQSHAAARAQIPPSSLLSSSSSSSLLLSSFHLLFHSPTKRHAFLSIACGPYCPEVATFHLSPPSRLSPSSAFPDLLSVSTVSRQKCVCVRVRMCVSDGSGRVLEEESNGFSRHKSKSYVQYLITQLWVFLAAFCQKLESRFLYWQFPSAPQSFFNVFHLIVLGWLTAFTLLVNFHFSRYRARRRVITEHAFDWETQLQVNAYVALCLLDRQMFIHCIDVKV